MRQQLEYMIDSYQPRTSAREQVYVVGDLEMLSAGILYSGESSGKESSERELYKKYISESIREDNHSPYGEHLNYEAKLNLGGHKAGRQVNLTNVHIPMRNGS